MSELGNQNSRRPTSKLLCQYRKWFIADHMRADTDAMTADDVVTGDTVTADAAIADVVTAHAEVVTADSDIVTADADVEAFRHDRLRRCFIAEIHTRRQNILRQRSQRCQLQLTDEKIEH